MLGNIKNFVWRLAKNSISTLELLRLRHIADDDTFFLCNSAGDSWRHALINRRLSKCDWALIDEDLLSHMLACNHEDAKLWLSIMQDSVSEQEFTRILVTLWAEDMKGGCCSSKTL